MCIYKILLKSKKKTLLFAKKLSNICIKYKVTIYLHGEIGTGKTTFSQAFIKQVGYNKIIKSPTYKIIEEYKIKNKTLLHIDLYRINHKYELNTIGLPEYFTKSDICLIEWAERGGEYIKKPDISIHFFYVNKHRKIKIRYFSIIGKKILINFFSQNKNKIPNNTLVSSK